MPKLYLVRHGEAAAKWGEDRDPGLSELGREQAAAVAVALGGVGPLAIVSSPLKRCRETAAPLAEAWGRKIELREKVREVPSPTDDLEERGAWLRGFMMKSWEEVEESVRAWRQGVFDELATYGEDTVVFTHFIPINAVVGAAKGLPRVVNFRPDNGSVTVIHADAHGFTVLDLGDEAVTEVR